VWRCRVPPRQARQVQDRMVLSILLLLIAVSSPTPSRFVPMSTSSCVRMFRLCTFSLLGRPAQLCRGEERAQDEFDAGA